MSVSRDPVLSLRPFDYDSRADLEAMSRWSNDPEIRHLASLHEDAEALAKFVSPADVAKWAPRYRTTDPSVKKSWILLMDGEPVGEGSVRMDAPHALTREKGTAWLGIVVGEARARDRGLGGRFFSLIEDEARKLGARRAEIGVFEYNSRAIRMYERLGYRKIGEIPDFTWWNGRRWTDYRYLREL
jgi:RimJ/RimL family protein N-acetyltransferase